MIEPLLQKDAGLRLRFSLRRNQIHARVHASHEPPLDAEVHAAFGRINALRREEGLQEQAAATRFRVIRPPRLHEGRLEMDLAPINFAHFTILTDPRSDEPAREHVRQLLSDVAAGMPAGLESEDALFNAANPSPLGVEIVLITRDGKTLLRQRGASVLSAPRKWDVSVSGYCGEGDLAGDAIDLGATAEIKARRKLGHLPGDPREIRFTGLYHDVRSGAMDVLGFWRLDMTAEELVRITTRRAEEPFVWDSRDLLIDFGPQSAGDVLERPELSDMMPEARASLFLAFQDARQ